MKLLYTKAEIEAMPQSIKYEKSFDATPFSIKGLVCQEDVAGAWSTSIVAIYREGLLLGGYRRTYSSFGKDTFFPFEWKGQWYALYSANYTATRVLRLHGDDYEDWCGEAGGATGFCPVEYYLPRSFDTVTNEAEYLSTEFENARDYLNYSDFTKDAELVGAIIEYPGFGFMAGCYWGDDSSWKLRYIDYSKIEEKTLTIDERFGYHPLPPMPLPTCIDMRAWEKSHPLIITAQETYTVARPLTPKIKD